MLTACAKCNQCSKTGFFSEQTFPRLQFWGTGQEPILLIDDSVPSTVSSLQFFEFNFWDKKFATVEDENLELTLRLFEEHSRLVPTAHTTLGFDVYRYLEFLTGGHSDKITYTNAVRCIWDDEEETPPNEVIQLCKSFTNELFENKIAVITGEMGAKQMGLGKSYKPGEFGKRDEFGHILFIPALTEIKRRGEGPVYAKHFERLLRAIGVVK